MSDRMYVPRFNVMPDDEVRAFVKAIGTAQLVTVADDGTPEATFLPVLWRDDRLVGHVARANRHWRSSAGVRRAGDRARPGRLREPGVLRDQARARPGGADLELLDGRTLRGQVRTIDDKVWLRELVGELTDHHESGRADPWAVEDAPEIYIEKQLKAIVGVEMLVESVEAKAKLSQNRSDEDVAGVIEGLAGTDGDAVADAMRAPLTRQHAGQGTVRRMTQLPTPLVRT